MNPSSKQLYSHDVKAYPQIYKTNVGGTVQQIYIQCKQSTSTKKDKKV